MNAPSSAGRPADWPTHIQQRYGVRRRPEWLVPTLAVATVILVGLGTWYAWQRANPEISYRVTSYRTIADDHMEIAWDLQRARAEVAVCVLRARAPDGFDVAYVEVELPAVEGRTAHLYQLATAYRGLVAEVLGCGFGAAPPGMPGGQYRPGVTPPEQPWTP
jgi:hypothetical protein